MLFQIGPIRPTAEGLRIRARDPWRASLAITGAITLFYLTTPPSELVIDLERRGVAPRLAFVANASVQTVPAMVERALAPSPPPSAPAAWTRRASIWKRIRGVLPLVGPVLLGSIAEIEERTMALEARGFTRPGRRTLLWHPPDSGAPSASPAGCCWPVAFLIVVARAAGWLPWLG